MSDDSKAAECVEALKPLADAAIALRDSLAVRLPELPWSFDPENHGVSSRPGWGLIDANGSQICVHIETVGWREECSRADITDKARATAEFVVRAVNAHDDLLSALQGVLRSLGSPRYPDEVRAYDAAIAAIAKAKGSAAPVVSASAEGEEDAERFDGMS